MNAALPSNAPTSVVTIAATATAVPPNTITREDVKYYLGRVFEIPERRLEAMMSVVDNARARQHLAMILAAAEAFMCGASCGW